MAGEKPETGGGEDEKTRTAHRADGTDDSASFEAQIADEGTIPDKEPDSVSAPQD